MNNSKVLIINRTNSDNFGDQAISECMRALMMRHHLECTLGDIILAKNENTLKFDCKKPNFTRTVLTKKIDIDILILLKWFIKNQKIFHIKNLKSYRLIIIGGGELVQNDIRFAFSFFLWSMISKFRGIPLYLFGVGVVSRNKYRFAHKFFYKIAFRNINGVYTRDKNSSKNLYESFGIVAEEIPDVVFSMCIQREETRYAKNLVLLGITPFYRLRLHGASFDNEEHYYSEMLNIYNLYEAKGYECKIIYNNYRDYYSCLEFKEFCYLTTHKTIEIQIYQSLNQYKEIISRAKIIYSPRMHACILGLIYGAEVHPVVISEKLKTFENLYIKKEIRLNVLAAMINTKIKEIVDEVK